MRSRAVSRPFLCCASMAFAPPPWPIVSSSVLISATRSIISREFFSNSTDLGSMRDWIFVPLNLLFSRKSVLWPRNGPARPDVPGGRWILPRWNVLTCAVPAARIRVFTLLGEPLLFGGAYVLPWFCRTAPVCLQPHIAYFAGQTLGIRIKILRASNFCSVAGAPRLDHHQRTSEHQGEPHAVYGFGIGASRGNGRSDRLQRMCRCVSEVASGIFSRRRADRRRHRGLCRRGVTGDPGHRRRNQRSGGR